MIVISTSLTVRGEPSPPFHVEAWLPFRNYEMDYLLLTRGKGHILVGTFSSWDVERQREGYKTIDLIAEYNHLTWECNHLATFPPSFLEIERNLNS